jgi:hypothetical protein
VIKVAAYASGQRVDGADLRRIDLGRTLFADTGGKLSPYARA